MQVAGAECIDRVDRRKSHVHIPRAPRVVDDPLVLVFRRRRQASERDTSAREGHVEPRHQTKRERAPSDDKLEEAQAQSVEAPESREILLGVLSKRQLMQRHAAGCGRRLWWARLVLQRHGRLVVHVLRLRAGGDARGSCWVLALLHYVYFYYRL